VPWPPAGVKPYYSDEAVCIILGDCRDILPSLGPVDLVLTDPPYGMGEVYLRDGESITRRAVAEWDMAFEPSDFIWPSTPLVAFTVDWQIPAWYKLRPAGRLLTWVKPNPTPSFRKQIINACEFVFFDSPVIYKGWEKTQTAVVGPFEGNRSHPTQKPLWLISHLLQLFGGQIALDPFMGSGTTLRAAKDLGRKAIGIEIEERYCEVAANRMAQSVMAL